jgi:hypothetical protein
MPVTRQSPAHEDNFVAGMKVCFLRAYGRSFSPQCQAALPLIARKVGLEGIVSKRADSPYNSGRSPDWIKSKKPERASAEARSRGGLGRMASRKSEKFSCLT